MGMGTNIIIEKWKHDASRVHVHRGISTLVHGYDSGIASGATIEQVEAIKAIHDQLRADRGFGSIPYSLDVFCDMAGEVVESLDRVNEIRGQLEGFGVEGVDRLGEIQVAYLDWYARDLWAESAREMDDPWTDKASLSARIADMVNRYMADRKEPVPVG